MWCERPGQVQTVVQAFNGFHRDRKGVAWIPNLDIKSYFMDTNALVYGRTVISEFFLNDKNQTVEKIGLGGVAGGKKYIVR
eukprot:1340643-Amorphochlora_amoeboformis.AAC.1